MISELRLALASANDKIRSFENAKTTNESATLSASESNLKSSCSTFTQTVNDGEISTSDPLPTFPSLELKKARDAWSALFHDRREVQHKLANLDQLEKDFHHKIMLKNQKNERVECISLSTLR